MRLGAYILFTLFLLTNARLVGQSTIDTLFILRDYNPNISGLSETGSYVLWNITNDFEAPPYMRPYRRVQTKNAGKEEIIIYDEKGFESQYSIDNYGAILLQSTQKMILNESEVLFGDIQFTNALPEYQIYPQIGLTLNYTGSAKMSVNFTQLQKEIKKKKPNLWS